MTHRSWTPVRRGKIYCSPACGANCTYNDFVNTTNEAKELCKHLGKGWTPEVDENMHWYYRVRSPCGRVTVYDNRTKMYPKPMYTAFLGEPGGTGGRWAESGKTPEDAIRAVVRVAVEDLHKIGAMIFDMSTLSAIPSRKKMLTHATSLFLRSALQKA